MIVYKVVSKKRESVVVNQEAHRKAGLTLKYKKGSIVKAKRGTLGIWCYRDRQSAEGFSYSWGGRVIKVEGIGREKKVVAKSGDYLMESIKRFYENYRKYKKLNVAFLYNSYSMVPEEMVFFNKVKVLT